MSSVLIDDNNCLLIQSDDLSKFLLHPQWLRERLSEPDYVDTNNKQRLYEPSLLNQDLKIIEYSLEGNNLNIHFSDGAKGTFSLQNLLAEIKKVDIIPLKTPWKNNFTKLPIFDHEKLSNQKNLIKMLENFQQLGFVIISNISKAEGTVTKFAESLGPVRTTNFGKHFDVVSKPDPNDLAYTSLGLTAHTDNPYRKPIPGIQILHCIANEAKGGDSCLVDGFAIAEHLRETDKEAFEILTQTDVLFKFTDKDILLENYGKLIELDDFGNYVQSRFSGRLDFVTYLEPKKLEKFYSARRKIFNLYASKEFEINFRLEGGMLMMFDNLRILHGRTEYDVSTGFRHLQGCYIDHDSTEGKLRLLKSIKFNE